MKFYFINSFNKNYYSYFDYKDFYGLPYVNLIFTKGLKCIHVGWLCWSIQIQKS